MIATSSFTLDVSACRPRALYGEQARTTRPEVETFCSSCFWRRRGSPARCLRRRRGNGGRCGERGCRLGAVRRCAAAGARRYQRQRHLQQPRARRRGGRFGDRAGPRRLPVARYAAERVDRREHGRGARCCGCIGHRQPAGRRRGPLLAAGNRVNGNLQAFGNRGGVSLIGNAINGNLQCKENVPAPTGSGNTAASKEDQCRLL